MITGAPIEDYERDNYRKRLEEISEAERFTIKVARVFGTPDGLEVAEWILRELCGYWREPIIDLGAYKVGRTIINVLCQGDLGTWIELVKRRQSEANSSRADEKRKYNDLLKGKQ